VQECNDGGGKGGKIPRAPKGPNNVTSTFFDTSHFFRKTSGSNMGAPNLLFCGARNAFSEIWNSQHWCYLVYSQVFKSARPTREQTNVETARNDLPITHDAFRRKWDVKAVSRNVQIQPLLRQRHNVAIRLLCKSSFGAQSNLSLRSRAQADIKVEKNLFFLKKKHLLFGLKKHFFVFI